ncbi:unnamed protein product [Lampetra planeri]
MPAASPRAMQLPFLLLPLLLLTMSSAEQQQQPCYEGTLQRRQRTATVVLTGTVEDFFNERPAQRTFGCRIRVWRFIKGRELLPASVTGAERPRVSVEGFGDGAPVCDARVSPGDTRVFLLALGPGGALSLASSVIRVSMANLEALENTLDESTLDDKPFSAPMHGCRDMLCGFGATCEADGRNASRGVCRCSARNCAGLVAPVCGSDHVTYGSECELENAMCSMQRRIKVMGRGPCGAKDPCEGVRCGFGSVCVASAGLQRARCVCPTECPPSSSSSSSSSGTVCGSDGRDYPSECELNRQACGAGKVVYKVFDGPCDACKATRRLSDSGRLCRMEAGTLRAVVSPDPALCPPGRGPVCGDDGATYPSECAVVRTAALRGVALAKLHDGACTPAGKGARSWPRRGYSPVCGSDGVSYGNPCELRAVACATAVSISVAKYGPCDDAVAVTSPACSLGRVVPVCGSDAVTYANRCQLRLIACRLGKDVSVEHDGPCAVPPPPFKIKLSSLQPIMPRARPPTVAIPPPTGLLENLPWFPAKPAPAVMPPTRPPPPAAVKPPGVVPQKGTVEATTRKTTAAVGVAVATPTAKAAVTKAKLTTTTEDWFFDPWQVEAGSGVMGIPLPLPPFAGLTDEEQSGDGSDNEGSGDFHEEQIAPELKSSCENTKHGCCPDGRTLAVYANKTGCPPTRVFAGVMILDAPLAANMPAFTQETSEQLAELRASTETTLYNLLASSDVKDDFKTMQVKLIEDSHVTLEMHFDPQTRFSPRDVERALVKQLISSRRRPINVKRPEEKNIKIVDYGTLKDGSKSVTATAALGPCDQNPCLHGGSCVPNKSEFFCCCPLGRWGKVCESEISFFDPLFIGMSYMVLGLGSIRLSHKTHLRLGFTASQGNGLLLYAGEASGRDFISLALVDHHVEFRFNAGSGSAVLTSRKEVMAGEWHQVWVERTHRTAVLSVDKEPPVMGTSPGSLDSLNLDSEFYLGGAPRDLMPRIVDQTTAMKGFIGCINHLSLNDVKFSLAWPPGRLVASGLASPGVLHGTCVAGCIANPCRPNPCYNSGICASHESEPFQCTCEPGFTGATCADRPQPCKSSPCKGGSKCLVLPDGNYKCECPFNRVGAKCEKKMILSGASFIPSFNGLTSYIETKSLDLLAPNAKNQITVEVVFLMRKPDGMIFYNGQKPDGRGDFISLAITKGSLEFRYDLGKGAAIIRSATPLMLNIWHMVTVSRTGRKGFMKINSGSKVLGEAPGNHLSLDLREALFLGGVPDYTRTARAAAITSGLDGAIQKFSVSGFNVLLDVVSSRFLLDVTTFREHPCTSGNKYCRNGGTCVPNLSGYECSCPRGFSGKTCQTAPTDRAAVALDEPVAFNGKTFIEYQSNNAKSDKAQKTNYFEMSVRTDATQGLILWAGKGTERADYLAIAIVNGYIQMTYDLGSRPVTLTSTVMVNTSKWVRIKAVRNQREGSLQVGNEAAVMATSPFKATLLDTDGTLWLGGMGKPPYNLRLPKAYSTGFVGCIRDMVVDLKELRIEEDAVNKPKISHCTGK